VGTDTYTVAVVDDAAEVRVLVRRHLALSGRFIVVGEGADGGEAVEIVERHRPDVLLLDVSMPGLDGLSALPKIRAAAPDTVVLMYTGFDEVGLAHRARQLGAAALIEKSLPLDRLAGEIAGTVERARSGALPGPDALLPSDERTPDDVLDEHLERFRAVFEEAAIGMATLTLAGTIVRANRALGNLLERDVSDLVGASYPALALPEHSARIADTLHTAQSGTGAIVRFEHPVPHEGGESWLLATVSPVTDAQSRPLYLFMQVQDVTAQRSAEEDLRQSEERFRLLVEAVRDYAIFMLDPTGHVISWNTGAQRIKGYTAREIIGQHFRVFYPPETQAIKHPEHELTLALRDGVYEEEGWRVRKDGSRFWASVVITAVRDQDGRHVGFAKVTRNIDERRRMLSDLEHAAEALAGANADLESANVRLAAEAADQAQFLAVTAHELRSPVTVLSGSASLLADHWAEMTDAERAELFESIQLGADRLQRLLNDLLTASQLESAGAVPRLQEVDLAQVLDHAVAAARAAHPRAEFHMECPQAITVLGEPDRLAQAFDNLLANAIRHGASPVRVRCSRDGDQARVAVSDAGPGVAPELRERLFQRYSRGGRRGGTGLGLFIVRELARAYGGDAWYQPEDTASGSFVVSLRLAEASSRSLSDPAG
jgi:PAS domain S-box-containing protein